MKKKNENKEKCKMPCRKNFFIYEEIVQFFYLKMKKKNGKIIIIIIKKYMRKIIFSDL